MNVPSLHYLLPTTPDYAEPFMGSSFTHALAAVKFGIMQSIFSSPARLPGFLPTMLPRSRVAELKMLCIMGSLF